MMNGIHRAKFTDVQKLQRLLERSGFDAVIALSPENVAYTSGFYNPDLRLLRERLHITVWPAEGEATFIVHERKVERGIGAETFIEDVRGFGELESSPIRVLSEVLKEKGLDRSCIGVEKSYMVARHYEELKKLVPYAEIVGCDELFSEARMIKTPTEIDTLRKAAFATDKAIRIGYEMAQLGDTEKSIVDTIGGAITRLGADMVAFNVLAAGDRTYLVHHMAEIVEIQPGDILRVDYGGLFSGYYTDMARMAVVGKPSGRQRSIYSRLAEIQKRVIEEAKPGLPAAQLCWVAQKAHEELKLKFRGVVGHGIGLSVHEKPLLNPLEKRELAPNMVLCIELAYSEPGETYHVEDMVLVTAKGPQVLTNYTNGDELYIIE